MEGKLLRWWNCCEPQATIECNSKNRSWSLSCCLNQSSMITDHSMETDHTHSSVCGKHWTSTYLKALWLDGLMAWCVRLELKTVQSWCQEKVKNLITVNAAFKGWALCGPLMCRLTSGAIAFVRWKKPFNVFCVKLLLYMEAAQGKNKQPTTRNLPKWWVLVMTV